MSRGGIDFLTWDRGWSSVFSARQICEIVAQATAFCAGMTSMITRTTTILPSFLPRSVPLFSNKINPPRRAIIPNTTFTPSPSPWSIVHRSYADDIHSSPFKYSMRDQLVAVLVVGRRRRRRRSSPSPSPSISPSRLLLRRRRARVQRDARVAAWCLSLR